MVAPIITTDPVMGPGGSGFVGRAEELELLLDFLTPATPVVQALPSAAALPDSDSGRGVVVVSAAVAGTAGVGKTALALHAAALAVGRGWCPGGAVWVDLRGYDPDPDEQLWPAQLYGAVVPRAGLVARTNPRG